MFLLRRLNISNIAAGSLRDRMAAGSSSDNRGADFEYCVWMAVPSHSPHYPQVLMRVIMSL